MRKRTLGRALCLACASLLVAAGSAYAATTVIVPGKSIGGAALGMTPAQVTAVLGTPPQAFEGSFIYAGGKLVVIFNGPQSLPGAFVRLLATASPSFSTAKGIRVGSRFAALRSAYPTLRCAVKARTGFQDFPIRKVPAAAVAGKKVIFCTSTTRPGTQYGFATPTGGGLAESTQARRNSTIQVVSILPSA